MPKAKLDPVAEGEVVRFEAAYEATHGAKQAVVQAKCDQNSGRWYCATHRKGFANQFQKDIHIESGAHRMAWVCFEHGIEVP